MLREQPSRLIVTLADDLEYFLIDGTRGLVAEGLVTAEAIETVQVGILSRRELNQAKTLAHPPASDHVARQGGRLLDVVLRAGRLGAVHDFFGGASTQHADDPRPQVAFRIVVAIAVRSLIRDA